MQQNPILHQSNRIVTVGLLSSYGQPKNRSNKQTITSAAFSTNANDLKVVGSEKENISRLPNPQLTLSKKDGTLMTWKYNYSLRSVFVDGVNKLDGIKFDWSNKLTVRINVGELGKLLSVLTSNEATTNLVHEVERDGIKFTATFTLQRTNGQITLQLGKKTGSETETVFLQLEQSDAALLTEFVRNSIRSGLGFE